MQANTTYQTSQRLSRGLGAIALLLLAGCQTYQQQSQEFTQASKNGSIAASVIQIDKQANEKSGSKDEIVWRLEQAATLRIAALADPSLVPDIRPPAPLPKKGEEPLPPLPELTPAEVHNHYFTRSVQAFDLAEAKVNHWEEQAKIKVGSEIGAMVTNQANLPYRGRSYDKVIMNTYKAINYLALGDKDKARVELNRAQQRQRDAVAANEERIAAARKDVELAKNGELKDEKGKTASYDSEKAINDPKTGPALQAALDASIVSMKPYGDYVNPFAVFLDGLFFTVLGEGGSDWEHGRKSFERVASMVPENPFLKADLASAAGVAEGKTLEGVTYVIFETGLAPVREQVRIDIPTFLVTSRLSYVGASFPKLAFNNNYLPSLNVTAGEETIGTSTVASMDSVVANDFKNEWPTIVTKTIITTATKAIIQAAVQKEVENRNGAFAGLAAGLILGAVNASTNIADTRTWTSLPKEFQYARVATPANHELTLAAGEIKQTVTLGAGAVNLVYVKSVSSTAPLLVSSFVLRL